MKSLQSYLKYFVPIKTKKTNKPGMVPAACVIITSLLLSALPAQAANVILEGNNVVRIEDLEVFLDQGGQTFFDVDFVSDTGFNVYGAELVFPFTEEDAGTTMVQVNQALNANIPVPTGSGPLGTRQYFIGADEDPLTGLIGGVGGEYFSSGFWNRCDTDCILGIKPLNPNDTFTYAVFSPADPSGNQPPQANPGGPYTGEVGVSVSFDGSGSTDEDGSISTYTWDFGDSTSGSGITASHTYTAAGNYNVNLTVTDNEGASDSGGTTANIGASSQPETNDLVLAEGGPSGSWYNPGRNGEGFFVEIINTGGSDLISLAMFTYDGEGFPLWVSGAAVLGSLDTVSEVPVTQFDGPLWGSGYNMDDLNATPFGTITVSFPTCDTALFQINTDVNLEDYNYSLVRLSSVKGVVCNDTPPQQSYTPGRWSGPGVCFNVAEDGLSITEIGSTCPLGNAFDADLEGLANDLDECHVKADCEGGWNIEAGVFTCVSATGALAIGNFDSFTSASGFAFDGESGQGEICKADWMASPE